MARTAAILVLLCSIAFSLTAVHGHRDLKQVAVPYYYGDYVDECFAGLDVIAALNQTDNLTTLIDAFYAAGLDYTLSDPLLSVTIFAPNDAAFTAAAATLGLSQTQLLNSPLLLPILLYHIVDAPLLTTDLANNEILPTLLEQNLTVLLNTSSVTTQSVGSVVGSAAAPNVTLNATESKATIIDGDWCNCEVCNVVVQVIDEVLLPQIVSVQTNDSEVLITIGNGKGQTQQFLIIYEDLAPAPTPTVTTATVSPPPPATATVPASSGLITEAASTPSNTPSGSSGQTTTAGTTFFTNSALNS